MKKITLALFTIITSLFIISCGKAKTDANGCYIDFDDAVEAANKKNQDIMLIITMDGDDEDSTDFMNKIVRDGNFKKDIAEKYAVVNMDFSQKVFEAATPAEDASEKDKKTADEKASLLEKNTKLVTSLQVSDIPVVFLLSKEKYIIKGFFYDDENRTLDGFKASIEEKSAIIDSMHKMIYQTKIGSADEKVNAINELYEATSPSYRFFLYDLVDSVKKLDPTNKSGLTGKYIYEAAVIKSDKAYMENDIRGAVQAYIDIVDEPFIPAESRQIAMYTAAYMASKTELDPIPVVIGYLEKSIQLAPESNQVSAIKRVIAALQAQAEEESKTE